MGKVNSRNCYAYAARAAARPVGTCVVDFASVPLPQQSQQETFRLRRTSTRVCFVYAILRIAAAQERPKARCSAGAENPLSRILPL